MSEILVTPALQNSIMFHAAKRTALQQYRNEISTLVVGSSHGDCGFNPEFFPGSFNLCSSSQDLKFSSLLYEKAAEQCAGIRNVILFYSVFSPGSVLEKSPSENYHALSLNELFNLGLEFEEMDETSAWLRSNIKGRLEGLSKQAGYMGFVANEGKGFIGEAYGAQNRANDHLRFSRSDGAHLYLIRMLLKAKALGHRTFIVLSPVRSDYKAAILTRNPRVFNRLFELLSQFELGYRPTLIDFFSDNHIDDVHFADYDHLSPSGAGVAFLTKRIEQIVNAN